VNNIIRIGVDTSKSVFQLHGVDAGEQAVLRKVAAPARYAGLFERLPATKVGMEVLAFARTVR
jgi:transposase